MGCSPCWAWRASAMAQSWSRNVFATSPTPSFRRSSVLSGSSKTNSSQPWAKSPINTKLCLDNTAVSGFILVFAMRLPLLSWTSRPCDASIACLECHSVMFRPQHASRQTIVFYCKDSTSLTIWQSVLIWMTHFLLSFLHIWCCFRPAQLVPRPC